MDSFAVIETVVSGYPSLVQHLSELWTKVDKSLNAPDVFLSRLDTDTGTMESPSPSRQTYKRSKLLHLQNSPFSFIKPSILVEELIVENPLYDRDLRCVYGNHRYISFDPLTPLSVRNLSLKAFITASLLS